MSWAWMLLRLAANVIGRWCRRVDGDGSRHGLSIHLDAKTDGVTLAAGFGRDGDLDGDGNGNEECDRRLTTRPRRNPWPFVIEPGDLMHRDKLTTLWKWSLARNWRRETDLLRFVTLAISCERRAREGVIDNAAGAFTSFCRQGLWWGTCDDEAKAMTLIAGGFDTS